MYCDNCPADVIKFEITLESGQVFYVCDDCLIETIKENAYTDNPVHSIEEIENAD